MSTEWRGVSEFKFLLPLTTTPFVCSLADVAFTSSLGALELFLGRMLDRPPCESIASCPGFQNFLTLCFGICSVGIPSDLDHPYQLPAVGPSNFNPYHMERPLPRFGSTVSSNSRSSCLRCGPNFNFCPSPRATLLLHLASKLLTTTLMLLDSASLEELLRHHPSREGCPRCVDLHRQDWGAA